MFTFRSFFIGRFLSPTFFSLVLFALGHELVVAQPVVNTTGILSITTKQQASLGVQVAAVQASTGGQLLASATVVMPPGKEFTVSAPYAGQVSRLLVGVGDSVKAGAALAHFTSPMLGDARRLLNEASLEYKNSSAAAQRDQAMFDEGIIPAVRLQLSRSKQEAAKAQLNAREAELLTSGMRFDVNSGYATGTLKAPLSGIISEAFVAVGQRVEAGTMLFKLADSSQLQLDLQLSSEKAAQLQVGDEISVATRNAKAKIIGVSRAVDASQSARARATVTTRGSLQAGELVSLTIHPKGKVSSDKPDTYWLVPARAVTQWRGKPWIFVANDKGFEAKTVNVISSTDDLSLIEVALPLSSKVAITGIASLRALLQKDE
ncbi:RND_mfp, efflux transporter, RND family, MFP subunit [Burkholderiaceae bacterium]|jgi:RND family efflux transporter MFP subunit